MNLTTNTTTTADSNLTTALFSAQRDGDGSWVFSDRETDVWGHGRTLLEAMCDYWAALSSHIDVLSDGPLSPRLERQLKVMRERRESA